MSENVDVIPRVSRRLTALMIVDILLGIIVPLLCLIFDPIVFKHGSCLGAASYLSRYRVFAYLAIGLGMLALGCWLVFGQNQRQWNGFLSGILLSGAVFSVVLGIFMLPFSLLGLLVYFIGVLGLAPFGAAFVFLRNGLNALQQAEAFGLTNHSARLWVSVFAGAILVLGIPALIQWSISCLVVQSLNTITTSSDDRAIFVAAETLEVLYVVCGDLCVADLAAEIDKAYVSPEHERYGTLVSTYEQMSGKRYDDRVCASWVDNVLGSYPP